MRYDMRDCLDFALEALPLVIPLIVDYAMKRKIEEHSQHLFSEDNLEHTKDMAMTIKQQLNIDPQYSTFHIRDGVFTRKAKESIKSVLDKLEEEKREELLYKVYPKLKNIEADAKPERDMIVIPPKY